MLIDALLKVFGGIHARSRFLRSRSIPRPRGYYKGEGIKNFTRGELGNFFGSVAAELSGVAGATVTQILIPLGDLARPRKLLNRETFGRFIGHQKFSTANSHA